jgi:hypothetical protein
MISAGTSVMAAMSWAGLPDAEQGLATGLATMSQQVGITVSIPVMSAIATARVHALGAATAGNVLDGISTALAVNAALAAVAAIALAASRGRRTAGPRRS